MLETGATVNLIYTCISTNIYIHIFLYTFSVAVTQRPACPYNQVPDDCNAHCVPTCDNPNPICTLACISGCGCPDDLPIRLSDGTCGRIAQCDEDTSETSSKYKNKLRFVRFI